MLLVRTFFRGGARLARTIVGCISDTINYRSQEAGRFRKYNKTVSVGTEGHVPALALT